METQLKYLVAELTEDEHKEVKKAAIDSNKTMKQWLCEAIVFKLHMERRANGNSNKNKI